MNIDLFYSGGTDMLQQKMIEKMTAFYKGNKHDIAHFLKVYAWAQTSGKMEGLDDKTQLLTELTAIVHDISCPLCREKYGSADPKCQEKESEALLKVFLEEFDLDEDIEEKIIWNVSHHHTYTDVKGIDLQILLEADYLVNADESQYPAESIIKFRNNVFRTESGKRLLNSIYTIE